MNGKSIITNESLMRATAVRIKNEFGNLSALRGATKNLEGLAPKMRHETLRAKLESKSANELLHSNASATIANRLRRIGFTDEVIQSATTGGTTLEGRFDSKKRRLERLIGRNELLPVRYLDGGQAAAKAVARVVVNSASGSLLGYGTGSMISPSLIMTNNHVLSSKDIAGASVVEFNYQLGLSGVELRRVTFKLRPDLFFATSPQDELDTTIVAVSAEPNTSVNGLADFGFNSLSADRNEILAGESVTIIQHPSGNLKQIALRENQVLRLPNTGDRFLYYETDTTPGSSGSPVFNDQWEVVALHHSGFPETDEQGRILTPDGQIWQEEMGDERIHWIANEGVRVTAIRDFLSNLPQLNSAQGTIRDQALRLDRSPQSPVADEGKGTGVPRVTVQTSEPHRPTQTSALGTAVWNIPLTVSVTIGEPAILGIPPTVDPTLDASSSAMAILDKEPTEGDFETAKRMIAEAQGRPYFDETKDQTDREAYYQTIDSAMSPMKMFEVLNNLLASSHLRKLAYRPSTYLYPWVDLQPNGKIMSIYSNRIFSPLELIERDQEISRLRRERITQFRASESAISPMLESAFMESLEAQLPYNCEHVVPQSWFRKKAPMRGDLHHLFACESGCNSFRSNTPYFDFTDFNEAIRSDCGKSETNKFEPNAGKGTVARATLYFLLRYPGEINATSKEYTADRLNVLFAWHKDFLVTEYERHRNQAIFAAQGNRNPLIDHPEWLDKIDFARGLG